MRPLLNAASCLLLLALIGVWYMRKSGHDVPNFAGTYIVIAFALVEALLWKMQTHRE